MAQVPAHRPPRRRAAVALATGAVLLAGWLPALAPQADAGAGRARDAARVDRQDLRLGALAVQAQALATGALHHPVRTHRPAVRLYDSSLALLRQARALDPSRRPRDTRRVMGRPPFNIAHHVRHRPWHRPHAATHTLRRFHRPVSVGGSAGTGHSVRHDGVLPAPYQRADGVYVDPRLASPRRPTVAAVALRSALRTLGQPYVWAAAGPSTFDCSGLVRWAYGHAGIALTHFTGSQWNEGRLLPARDALPGDLVLIGHPIHHVGIYLGAGWMVNAPYTGHYVDVVPVPTTVDGLVRP